MTQFAVAAALSLLCGAALAYSTTADGGGVVRSASLGVVELGVMAAVVTAGRRSGDDFDGPDGPPVAF